MNRSISENVRWLMKVKTKIKHESGRIPLRNKKLVYYVIEEYWDEICPVCGNTTPPKINCSKNEFRLKIDLSCPKCSMTVSFRKSHLIKNYRSSKKVNSINLSPNIFTNCFGD
jgi:hypothetical protein